MAGIYTDYTNVIDQHEATHFADANGINTSGRTANDDGNKTGGGGKFWNGMNNAADFLGNLFGDKTYNVTNNESSKMSAGVWIAIVGVILVVVVLAVVLVNRNK